MEQQSYFRTAGGGVVHMTPQDQGIVAEFSRLTALRNGKKALYGAMSTSVQPPNSEQLFWPGSIAVSLMANNTTYTLIDRQIPDGCVGVLKNRANWFNGSGFIEGSASLTWSILVGEGYLYDHGSILYTIGPDQGTELASDGGGLILRPNLRIRYQVTTGDISGLDSVGVVLARLKGWIVPAP